MRYVSDKFCRVIQNTHFTFNKVLFPRKSYRLWDNVEKCNSARQARWQYGACALHAWYLNLQTVTQNTLYLLLFHCDNGYTKALPYCIIPTSPVLSIMHFAWYLMKSIHVVCLVIKWNKPAVWVSLFFTTFVFVGKSFAHTSKPFMDRCYARNFRVQILSDVIYVSNTR